MWFCEQKIPETFCPGFFVVRPGEILPYVVIHQLVPWLDYGWM
jgi:hypothetical protein